MSYNSYPRSRSNDRQYNRVNSPFRGQRPARRGAYIDPQRFVNSATLPQNAENFIPKYSFEDFGLVEKVVYNIKYHKYTTPTPIQDQAIPIIMEGRDLIGLANTGTGKTAAFILPIINKLLEIRGQGTALVIAPTRELAVQIDEEFRSFAYGLQLYSALCVGGASMHRQISTLARRPQIVIGTPGRMRDLVEQGCLRLATTRILVLDEADRMLDMGFSRDINFLVDQLPKERQSLCFSATMPDDVKKLVCQLLTEPITVSVKTSETSDHVEQNIIRVQSKEQKVEILSELLSRPDFGKVLIFGQTKHGVQRLADNLEKQGFATAAIHGNKSQPQRQRALQAFKNNEVQALVATDVAARGLDIPNVTHVINFDQPESYQDYIHRIGRTGRAGNIGQALTFVS